jgi:hypothetical protein
MLNGMFGVLPTMTSARPPPPLGPPEALAGSEKDWKW